jgi:hypothetical protein
MVITEFMGHKYASFDQADEHEGNVVDDSLLKYWLETGYPHQSFV